MSITPVPAERIGIFSPPCRSAPQHVRAEKTRIGAQAKETYETKASKDDVSLIKIPGQETASKLSVTRSKPATAGRPRRRKMKAIHSICAAAALVLIAGAPAYAQMSNDSMSKGATMSDSKMKMSMADKKMMTKCQGMGHDMMMKDKGCMKMMKMHPDMMKGHM
jgi:hypothetical protein